MLRVGAVLLSLNIRWVPEEKSSQEGGTDHVSNSEDLRREKITPTRRFSQTTDHTDDEEEDSSYRRRRRMREEVAFRDDRTNSHGIDEIGSLLVVSSPSCPLNQLFDSEVDSRLSRSER